MIAGSMGIADRSELEGIGERAASGRRSLQPCILRLALLPAALCLAFALPGLAFQVTPANPQPGQELLLEGTGSPGEEISFKSSFSMNLPVAGGQYEYETRVKVPQKPNRFTVAVSNVAEFNAGVKVGIWITKGFTPSGGRVSLSQADVPPGQYNLKMFGKALSGASYVPVTVQAETAVKADPSGRYRLAIDTTGIPAGDYIITGAGETKTIRLGGIGSPSGASTAVSAGASSFSGSSDRPATSIGVDRKTVLWYAGQMGMDANNSSQYDQAEEMLKKRLSGGYWKIIGRGEPLTEEAGDCMQEYCLVRGIDACTACRDKDIILKGVNASGAGRQAASVANCSIAEGANQSNLRAEAREETGFFSSAVEWLEGLLGIL